VNNVIRFKGQRLWFMMERVHYNDQVLVTYKKKKQIIRVLENYSERSLLKKSLKKIQKFYQKKKKKNRMVTFA